jgi:hypothetical protein
MTARLFYAVAAAKNLLVFGADVSNAFAEAPPPKQPFFIRPDCAFHEWWVIHLKRDPIPDGHMIPILSAMQGHQESPRLWEKHADKILREIGLTPMVLLWHFQSLTNPLYATMCGPILISQAPLTLVRQRGMRAQGVLFAMLPRKSRPFCSARQSSAV